MAAPFKGKAGGGISRRPRSGKSLAEFAPAGAKKIGSIFGGGVYVAENSSRPANVRVCACRTRRALQQAAAFSNDSPAKRVSFELL